MHLFEDRAHLIYVWCVVGIFSCVFSILFIQRQYVLNLIVENIGYEREKYFGDLIFDLYKNFPQVKINIQYKKISEKIKRKIDKLNKIAQMIKV